MEDERKVIENIPAEYKPISMWGYFGYEILFSIPIVGLIAALILSFGGTKNRNLKNYARAQFCILIIAIVIIALLVVTGNTATLASAME